MYSTNCLAFIYRRERGIVDGISLAFFSLLPLLLPCRLARSALFFLFYVIRASNAEIPIPDNRDWGLWDLYLLLASCLLSSDSSLPALWIGFASVLSVSLESTSWRDPCNFEGFRVWMFPLWFIWFSRIEDAGPRGLAGFFHWKKKEALFVFGSGSIFFVQERKAFVFSLGRGWCLRGLFVHQSFVGFAYRYPYCHLIQLCWGKIMDAAEVEGNLFIAGDAKVLMLSSDLILESV